MLLFNHRDHPFKAVVADDPSVDQTGNDPLSGRDPLSDNFYRLVKINTIAASEKVNSGIFVFRPGVDSEMGFADDDHAGNSLRFKLVEPGVYDRGA